MSSAKNFVNTFRKIVTYEPIQVRINKAIKILENTFDIIPVHSDRNLLRKIILKHCKIVEKIKSWHDLYLPENQAVIEYIVATHHSANIPHDLLKELVEKPRRNEGLNTLLREHRQAYDVSFFGEY